MSKKQVTLGISGMTCASCSAAVEKTLNKIDGVDASVNLAMEKATIEFDTEKINLKRYLQLMICFLILRNDKNLMRVK